MATELDPTRMSIDEQVTYLLEDTYFADEAQGVPTGGLRSQMAAELKAKLELAEKLRAKGRPDWPLRVYIGADPTRTSLHIGHMVSVARMAKFQRLGHQCIFLIGDYTAMIGDPTDQTAERAQLTHEAVMEMSRFYTDQAHRLLHADTREVSYTGGTLTELGAEVRYNGEWLAGLGFAALAQIAAQFSVAQIVARKDFRERIEAGGYVGLHESFYALMQGYDSYALNCDVQVGGYDQHMNLLAGRDLQRYFSKLAAGQKHPLRPDEPVKGPHVMLTYPLLMGTDGRKMSKSWGNTIDVLDSPEDMFGKVMRISDAMIAHYIDVALEARPAEKDEMKARAASEPMAVKKWIAQKITAMYNGESAAAKAEEHFRRTVQERGVDMEQVPDVRVPDAYRMVGATHASPENRSGKPTTGDACVAPTANSEVQQELQPRLVDLIVELQLAPSKSEARRLLTQGGIKLDGAAVTDPFTPYIHVAPILLQVGKRKVVRLI